MKVVGFIGAIGSGKTSAAKYVVEKHGGRLFRFSDVLRDVLERLHRENTRDNLQRLGASLREGFGEGILAQVLYEDVKKSQVDVAVVDGIRYADEYNLVKKLSGTIIYVYSPPKVRYERVINRGTRGEADLSFKQFLENEANTTEKSIERLGGRADYIVECQGDLDELHGLLDDVLSQFM